MSVPMRSAGSRSGVNWMRWKPVWMQLRERLDGERLGQAGHAFEQHVAIGQQADEQAIDEILLPDDDARDFLLERRDPLAGFFDLLGDFLGAAGHKGVR